MLKKKKKKKKGGGKKKKKKGARSFSNARFSGQFPHHREVATPRSRRARRTGSDLAPGPPAKTPSHRALRAGGQR